MNKTESAIHELQVQGFDPISIMDALCDGEALESMGLGDGDQDDIEAAFSALNISSTAAILGRKGGLVKSERKAKSSAENGKKGGRPRKVIDNQGLGGNV